MVFFPMNTARRAPEVRGYHWTLLVLDLKLKEWRHYNSMTQRRVNNMFTRDAKEMVKKSYSLRELYFQRNLSCTNSFNKFAEKICHTDIQCPISRAWDGVA